MTTRLFSVYVKLPARGSRCGEKISMWRDDVIAAVGTTREAAKAAARLLDEPTEIWERPAVREPEHHSCYCGDDD